MIQPAGPGPGDPRELDSEPAGNFKLSLVRRGPLKRRISSLAGQVASSASLKLGQPDSEPEAIGTGPRPGGGSAF
jgi:hypothetical protein